MWHDVNTMVCFQLTKRPQNRKMLAEEHKSVTDRMAKNPVFKPKIGYVYVAQQDRATAS